MEKTILIAGKDLPDGLDFSDGALMTGRNVVAATSRSANTKQAVEGGIVSALWNRMSPISSRSLVIECENYFRRLDEAVFYFDEAYFAQKFDGMNIENCAVGTDEMILGFQFLVQEILVRFEKRFAIDFAQNNSVKPPKLVFLLKSSPSEVDILKNNALRNTVACASGPFVASASAAFLALAENIAAMFGGRDYVNVLLVRADVSMDMGRADKMLANWLCNYLNAVDDFKHKLNAKQSLSWIRAGSKIPSATFGIFK